MSGKKEKRCEKREEEEEVDFVAERKRKGKVFFVDQC